ncbi:hypothetical protein [Psychroserpens damuponensis]|uniref:hypothetical protein n=1 Tax=Psychroserpens damuponensis TaxID=943936 RepID=UPI000AF15549|nr:hypothetical protein [Psychroserpens damuponensis]
MEFIFELILRCILHYPGAYIRRFIFEEEHDIEYYLKDSLINTFVSLLVITFLIVIFIVSKHFFFG